MNNDIDTNLSELEVLLTIQEIYFDYLIRMGIIFENAGQPKKQLILIKQE